MTSIKASILQMEDNNYKPVLGEYIRRLWTTGWPNHSQEAHYYSEIFKSCGYTPPFPRSLSQSRAALTRQITSGTTPRWVRWDPELLPIYQKVLRKYQQYQPKYTRPIVKKSQELNKKPKEAPPEFQDPDHYNTLSAKLAETENSIRKYEVELVNNEEIVRVQLEKLNRTKMELDMLIAELQERNDHVEKQYVELQKSYSNAKLLHITIDQLKKYRSDLQLFEIRKNISPLICRKEFDNPTDRTPPRAPAGSDSQNGNLRD